MSEDLQRLVDRDQIRLLLAIVDAKSFSGAAATLGVTQPSVSQQVKRIEKLAGRTLFRRTRVGVELTADGEAVVIYARAMLALTDDLKRQLAQSSGRVKIAIAMSEDFCRTALPSVLWLFMREHVHADVRIVTGPYDTLLAATRAHDVDLAVMRRLGDGGDATLLWRDALVWVGRPDLALPVADPVPIILPTAPNPTRDVLIETLRAHGRTWRVPFETFSLASIEAALQAGIGVCASPRHMRLHGVAQLDARCGLPPLPAVDYVMIEPHRGASPAVHAFAAILRQAATSSFRVDIGGAP